MSKVPWSVVFEDGTRYEGEIYSWLANVLLFVFLCVLSIGLYATVARIFSFIRDGFW